MSFVNNETDGGDISFSLQLQCSSAIKYDGGLLSENVTNSVTYRLNKPTLILVDQGRTAYSNSCSIDWAKTDLNSSCLLLTASEDLWNGFRTRSAHLNLYQSVHKKQISMATISNRCIIGIRFLSVRLMADARGYPSGVLAACMFICIRQAGDLWRPGARLQIKSNATTTYN